MNSFILGMHLFGSLIFIVYVLVILFQIVTAKDNYTFMKRAAAVIGVHQFVTGLLLGVMSPELTIAAACMRGLFLLGVLVVLVSALSRRLVYVQAGAGSR